jgi:hypothetical protein
MSKADDSSDVQERIAICNEADHLSRLEGRIEFQSLGETLYSTAKLPVCDARWCITGGCTREQSERALWIMSKTIIHEFGETQGSKGRG